MEVELTKAEQLDTLLGSPQGPRAAIRGFLATQPTPEADWEWSPLQSEFLYRLVSNRYQQGFGQLRKGDSFCILGAAADTFNPSYWKSSSPLGWSYGDSEAYRLKLASMVKEAFLLRDQTAFQELFAGSYLEDLYQANDYLKLTFHDFYWLFRWAPSLFFYQTKEEYYAETGRVPSS